MQNSFQFCGFGFWGFFFFLFFLTPSVDEQSLVLHLLMTLCATQHPREERSAPGLGTVSPLSADAGSTAEHTLYPGSSFL